MSCCIGIALFGDNKQSNGNNYAYIKKSNIEPPPLNAPDLYKVSVEGMSKTDTMRVPPLPITSRDSPLKIVSKNSKDICRDFHSRKTSSPTSSAENVHFKTSSSDSSTSRDEIPELTSALATHVRIRPSTAAASIIPARTCFNFDASNKDEISFKRGSKVIVKSKPCIDDEYVLIEVDHREGYAPKRFLQPCGSAPQIINNSELVRAETLIGAGTFAKVYEVTYRGKKYALKEYIQQTFVKAEEEAECLNAMDHKNIVKVYGVCIYPPALLLEYCEGGQLSKLINPKFNPPLRVVLNWAIQIAEALWCVHDREIPICHMDIKPQNCLILEKPCICDPNYYRSENSNICSVCGFQRLSRLTLKLTDFGLAKPTQTARMSLSGSVPYMAPEYIRETIITPKADVWSFGVLLWEMLAKQTPYADLVDYGQAGMMYAIGTNEIHLPICETWPVELQNLLNACWDQFEEKRPTMKEVVEKLHQIPTTNPDYVLVGSVKKPAQSNRKVMEQLKQFFHKKNAPFNNNLYKPQVPPRKLSKHDIGSPQDMKQLSSIHDNDGLFEIHDHEENRKRYLSTHENGGTLPRETFRRGGGLGPAISTPELHNIGSTLERSNAMRRKHNSRGPDPINWPGSVNPVVLGSTTPSQDSASSFNFEENIVEVIDQPELIRVPRHSRDSNKGSPRRSPSSHSHSHSTFYVPHNDGAIVSTPTYDTSTIYSQSSVDSNTSRKHKSIFSISKYLPKSRHRESSTSNNFANPDCKSYNYLKLNGNFGNFVESEIFSLNRSPHLETVNLAQFIKPVINETPTTSHFVKLPNTPKKQRQYKLGEHRRNASNASERNSTMINNNNNHIVTPSSITSQKSPSFHHSSSEGASISSSHLSVSNYSPSRSSVINFDLEIPLPSSAASPTTFPVTNDEPFTQRDHRSRAFTTVTPILKDIIQPPAQPISHPRSRSTDVSSSYQNPMLADLADRMHDQLIVENTGYRTIQVVPKVPTPSAVATTSLDSQPYYVTLKSTNVMPAIQHNRSPKSADHIGAANAPPVPPPHNLLQTVVEMPKSKAPPPPAVPPRTHPSQNTTPSTSSSGYLALDNTITLRSSQSSPSTSLISTNPQYFEKRSISTVITDDQIPKSEAPPRPDTLPNRFRIERRNDGYVDISGQTRVPNIPRNMPHRRN